MAVARKSGSVAVVIDNGSHTLRAGLASDSAPSLVTPSIVASPGGPQQLVGRWRGRVGEAAERRRAGGAYVRPIIEHGVIQDEEAMVRLWVGVFKELKADLGEQPVLITEPFCAAGAARQIVAELLFEQCGVARMYLAKQEPLVLYSTGQTTGVVLNCGADTTSVIPVYDSFIQNDQSQFVSMGGRQLTQYLWRLLSKRHMHLTPTPQHEVIEEIKYKCCYVAKDFKEESERDVDDISLGFNVDSNNGLVTVDRERYQCPEALFNPALIGSTSHGIHHITRHVIGQFKDDVMAKLYPIIVCAGGSTMFPGFKSRFEAEIAAVAPPLYKKKVGIIAPKEGLNSVWRGGALLSKMASFEDMWVTREQYTECGSAVVHRYCQS